MEEAASVSSVSSETLLNLGLTVETVLLPCSLNAAPVCAMRAYSGCEGTFGGHPVERRCQLSVLPVTSGDPGKTQPQ